MFKNLQPTPVPFQWGPAAFAVVWIGFSIALWYSNRDSWIGGTRTVVPLYTAGTLLYMVILTRSLKIKLRDLSRETWVVVGSALVLFALFWHFGRRGSYPFPTQNTPRRVLDLYTFAYFSGCSVLLRLLVPLFIGTKVLGKKPEDYGYRLKGTLRFTWVYALAFLLAVPMVWIAAQSPAFITKYPLCRGSIIDGSLPLQSFLIYQVTYALIFVSGESFWRGYILFGAGRQLGRNAFMIMLFPYVICHFGKPAAETIGAIGAGLFLGFLAWEHRSFWLGVALHWGVAILMDVFALINRGTKVVWGG